MGRLKILLLPGAITLHLAWQFIEPEQSMARDLFLYNFIWLFALTLIAFAPISFDRVALASMSIAILLWGIGSLASSIDQFFSSTPRFLLVSQLLYTLFYPLMLIAITRFSVAKARLRPIELLDSLIFGLGFTSLISALLMAMIFSDDSLLQSSNYFLTFYPVGDLSLLLVLAMTSVTRKITLKSGLLALGITIFAFSDIYYLWLALNDRYSFGGLADSGWLIAIVFIALSTSGKGDPAYQLRPIHPALVALSIFTTPVLLAISVLRPQILPTYILLPSLVNLLLAFIRMNTALGEARALVNERNLARTDELTGLANRRRLLTEIENFSEVEGALLLLDLNQFKPVNDNYGHDVGDLLLREVARRFTRVIPEGSILARLGGDEFGVLIPGSLEHTVESAHALRACLSYPCQIKGISISVGVSIGHVYNDGSGNLLKRADDAMYRAKQMDMGVAQSLSL
jgi:diguanylate cyclase (GGDEF)-like protein